LENIIKTCAVPVGITALEVPLHEGMHAVTATVLPSVHCDGIVLSANHWYSYALQAITFGYVKAQELPAQLAGYAKISQNDSFLGNLDGALTAALPEVATMTLGMYWISQGIQNIKERGKRLSAVVKAYCGFTLIAGTQAYMNMSVTHPEQGSDYYNFTESVLRMAHLPPSAAEYVTFVGTAAMVTGALYLTTLFSRAKPATPAISEIPHLS
jgi:hypothetical protein